MLFLRKAQLSAGTTSFEVLVALLHPSALALAAGRRQAANVSKEQARPFF